MNKSSSNNKIINLSKKLSSFELNLVEKEKILRKNNTSNNLDNLPLTDNLIDCESHAKSMSKASLNPKNMRNFKMSTLDSANETCSNKSNPISNTNFHISNQPCQLNTSPNLLNASRQNYRHHNNFQSSMELYRLKLSKSKLKAVTRTSALLSGFAMVAMVELALDYSDYFEAMKQAEIMKYSLASSTNSPVTNLNMTNQTVFSTTTKTFVPDSAQTINKFLVPESILILYSLVTCLLVGVHMLALMISTCILPQLEASAYDHFEFEQQLYKHEYNFLNQTFMLNPDMRNKNGLGTAGVLDDSFGRRNGFNEAEIIFPYKKFHRFIELAWISSTVFGIFLFLVEIGLVCYIKFYPISFIAAWTGAMVMTPILILFVIFTITFYKRLADFKVNITKHFLNQVDKNLLPLQDNIV